MIFILLPGVLIGAVMGLTGAGGGILAVPVLVGSGGVVNSLQVQRSFDFLNFNGGSILSGKLLLVTDLVLTLLGIPRPWARMHDI